MWLFVAIAQAIVTIENRDISEPNDYRNVDLTIKNTVFVDCSDDEDEHDGGAIDAHGCTVVMSSVLFENCVSYCAGAVSFTNSTIDMTDVNFTYNFAGENAGAGLFDNSKIKIFGGVSKGNEAQDTGVFAFQKCFGQVSNHVFIGNLAHYAGSGAVLVSSLPIKFSDCVFVHNHVEGGFAGAMTLENIVGELSVTKCAFISNEVIEECERHVYIEGNTSMHVQLVDCMFDTPLEDAIGEGSADGMAAVVRKIDLKFDLQTSNPWLHEAQNIEKNIWSVQMSHEDSDVFVAAMFFFIPIFVGGVVYALGVAV